ncbi:stationary phase mismatch/uracil DNA glycosylase [Campylobacter blaseri]|nr:stationary phase mismatch/uracil DNA glycosylase [Campylobacter blaseri]
MQTHPIKPVFNKSSKVLILGSFPSVISRKEQFYYANPQNRFWKVLANIFSSQIPKNKDEKIEFLLNYKIALYDAAISCKIEGSSDAKMSDIKPANLSEIFNTSNIVQVFANGNKAYEICQKYLKDDIVKATKKSIIKLPSTSPANAKFNLDMLIREWDIIARV